MKPVKIIVLGAILVLTPTLVSAQNDTNLDPSFNSRPKSVRATTSVKTMVEARVNLMNATSQSTSTGNQRVDIEEWRRNMMLKAEAKKIEAEARGDLVTAKKEELKLRLEEKWAEMDERREAKRLELEKKREEMQARRIELQRNIAKKLIEHVQRITLATIERLEKIVTRLESRIEKFKAKGAATTESENFVAAAKADLAKAKTSAEAFINIDISSDIAQENFERIREAVRTTREHIRSAHRNLMMAVRSLRAVEIDVEDTDESEAE